MNQLWINLPVKNIQKSKKFYRDVGFRYNPIHEDRNDVIGLLFGDQDFVVMLFPEETFEQYTGTSVADTSKGVETLLSFDMESKEAVRSFIDKVEPAGGHVYSKPRDHGDLFGAGFTDPDGHRWNVLYMGDLLKKEG